MPKLPQISGKELIKKLAKINYSVVRQKGSHVRLRHINPNNKAITVPLHKNIKQGLLYKILKDVNLTVDELKKL